jgi:GNAT superfamily N-acetyltransferase
MTEIKIIPFQPADQQAARSLILAGLEEHWGVLDETKNPDLDDIACAYASGIFLIAWERERIAGTGAYLPRSDYEIEIVRMSVRKEMRRQGIGRQILTALCLYARQAGYERAILETTRTWQEVIAFYRGFGFEFTHYQGEDSYFVKWL